MLENYFKLLGLAVDYRVDLQLLNANYLEIQRTIHPDNYANSSDLERRLSVQKAAQINDALQTLKSPLKRAIYMLSLAGMELKDNETAMEPAFLMQQMELREQLSSVKQQADPFQALDKMLSEVENTLKSFQQQLGELFQKGDSDSLDKAKNNVLKMQFLSRLQEECLNLEEELSNTL